ncbi:hypothetical protein J4442_02385 [Candidatus Woesearchaeota archaeon]|nr:hypothetical protein [Candidatus Woesearchaeota archaeon]
MATILDIGFLNFLLPVFTFLLIYAIVFGVLQKSKFLSESTNINTWVALAISVLFLLAPGAIEFVSVIAPWFVVLVVIAFSFLLIFFFMGIKPEVIEKVARNEASVRWTIIIISIIIIIVGLTSVFGPIFGTPADGEEGVGREVQRSIFDPQVLTTVFILLVAGQAVRLIAQQDK